MWTTFGDFIVWHENEPVVERIPIDEAFLTDTMKKATSFFTNGMLPEILGKWYTKTHEYSSAESLQASGCLQQNTLQDIWCFCRSDESGEMIACKNEQCQIIWFHTRASGFVQSVPMEEKERSFNIKIFVCVT